MDLRLCGLSCLGRLEPLVKSATEKIADPEVRGVAEKAYKTLQKAAGDGNAAENKFLEAKDALAVFKTALGDKDSGEEFDTVGLHFAELVAAATNMRQFVAAKWKSESGLGPFASVTEDIQVKFEVVLKPAEEIEEEDTEGVDLYKGSFSLVCGTLTLLRGTKMHLKRNGLCGLLGPSQCGTTTLMRAIVNEQLEGFPKAVSSRSFKEAGRISEQMRTREEERRALEEQSEELQSSLLTFWLRAGRPKRRLRRSF